MRPPRPVADSRSCTNASTSREAPLAARVVMALSIPPRLTLRTVGTSDLWRIKAFGAASLGGPAVGAPGAAGACFEERSNAYDGLGCERQVWHVLITRKDHVVETLPSPKQN